MSLTCVAATLYFIHSITSPPCIAGRNKHIHHWKAGGRGDWWQIMFLTVHTDRSSSRRTSKQGHIWCWAIFRRLKFIQRSVSDCTKDGKFPLSKLLYVLSTYVTCHFVFSDWAMGFVDPIFLVIVHPDFFHTGHSLLSLSPMIALPSVFLSIFLLNPLLTHSKSQSHSN